LRPEPMDSSGTRWSDRRAISSTTQWPLQRPTHPFCSPGSGASTGPTSNSRPPAPAPAPSPIGPWQAPGPRSRRGGHRIPLTVQESTLPNCCSSKTFLIVSAVLLVGWPCRVHGPPRSAAPGQITETAAPSPRAISTQTCRGWPGNRGGPAGAGLQHHDRLRSRWPSPKRTAPRNGCAAPGRRSHELRTPLTSIRGYAELFDLGIRRPA